MTNRRQFLTRGAAAIAAAALAPSVLSSCGEAPKSTPVSDGKPCSDFAGVHIGAISYSWRSMPAGLENIVKYAKESNCSNLELMSSDLETYLGIPANPANAFREAFNKQVAELKAKDPNAPTPALTYTPEQQAQIDKYAEDVKNFRVNVDMNKVAQAKKLFDDAGISIHIVKFSPANWSDDEIRYAFKVAKAMGAGAVTNEISQEAADRLAPFAKEAGMVIAFHNHMQYATEGFSCDPILAAGEAVMLNFDTGHYFGSTGKDPVAFIDKYHDRIFSIHLKDKTGPTRTPGNANQVWGQGESPLERILHCLQEKYPNIYADIELEYEIAPWSNQVKETATCVKYARQILL